MRTNVMEKSHESCLRVDINLISEHFGSDVHVSKEEGIGLVLDCHLSSLRLMEIMNL